MKRLIKRLLNGLGESLHGILKLPILIFISDAFLDAKVNEKSAVKIKEKAFNSLRQIFESVST